jgi:hypothetical protein
MPMFENKLFWIDNKYKCVLYNNIHLEIQMQR